MIPVILLTALFAFMLLWFHIPWIRQILFPVTESALIQHEALSKKAEKLRLKLQNADNVVTDKEKKAENFDALIKKQSCFFNTHIHFKESCIIKGELVANDGMNIEQGGELYRTCVQGNCHLGQGTVVRDWISVKGNLFVNKSCNLGKQVGVSGKVELGPECSFKSIVGHPITTYAAKGRERVGIEVLEGSIDKHAWYMSDQLMTIPKGVTIDHDLIVKGNLHVGENVTILKSIKCYGDVIISDRVHIKGNLFGEKTIRIGAQCRIDGNLFSQEEIYLGSETEVGHPEFSKSVIAKNKLYVCHSVTVWGKMATFGKGLVR